MLFKYKKGILSQKHWQLIKTFSNITYSLHLFNMFFYRQIFIYINISLFLDALQLLTKTVTQQILGIKYKYIQHMK